MKDVSHSVSIGLLTAVFFGVLALPTPAHSDIFFKSDVQNSRWSVYGGQIEAGDDACFLVTKNDSGDYLLFVKLIGSDREPILLVGSKMWTFRNFGNKSALFDVDVEVQIKESKMLKLLPTGRASADNEIMIPRFISGLGPISAFMFVSRERIAKNAQYYFNSIAVEIKGYRATFITAGIQDGFAELGRCIDAGR